MTAYGTYGVGLTVEAAFGYAPFATPVWTDVSKWVHRVLVQRGNGPTATPRSVAGRCTVWFDNDDGRFDSNNTSSPYSPDVNVTVPIRVQAEWDSTTYPVFYGFATAWQVTYPGMGSRSVTVVPCVDGLQLVQQATYGANGEAAESTDARIGNVLDAISWPAGLRDLDTGVADVEELAAQTGLSALTHLDAVATAEVGRIFVAADGDFTFHNRVHYSGTPASEATFGPADIPYSRVVPTYDDQYLYNSVTVNRESGAGTAQTSQDATSMTNHRHRELALIGACGDDACALNVAEWNVAMWKDVDTRIESIQVKPQNTPVTAWPAVLGIELRDAVTVKTDPPGGGTDLDLLSSVESIRHDIRLDRWVTTYQCHPIPSVQTDDYWILGTSALGTGTVLA